MKTEFIDEARPDPEIYECQLSDALQNAPNDPKLDKKVPVKSTTPATPHASFYFESDEMKTESINDAKADPERYNHQLLNAPKTAEND